MLNNFCISFNPLFFLLKSHLKFFISNLKFIFLIKINLFKQNFVIMKTIIFVCSTLLFVQTQAQSAYNNPFTNTYKPQSSNYTANVSVTNNNLPNYSAKPITPMTTTTTTVSASLPTYHTQPIVNTPQAVTHSHVVPLQQQQQQQPSHVQSHVQSYVPSYVPSHVNPTPSVYSSTSVPGNSNLSFQQIVQYLFQNSPNLNTLFQNGAKTFTSQCKGYCDALPHNPVCDDTNTLYRNECEANCFNRTVSTNNLRYGTCCCSDDDFNFESGTYTQYLFNTDEVCITACIYNCLGGTDLGTAAVSSGTTVGTCPVPA